MDRVVPHGPDRTQAGRRAAENVGMDRDWGPEARAWIARLAAAPLRVLGSTRDELAAWREQPDRVDAHRLAGIVLRDPALCLRVLCDTAEFNARLATPLETVTAALLVTGIERFFRSTEGLAGLEDHLQDNPPALHGALGLVERSWSAARIAAAFAIHRQDEDAELLHQAALLANVTELLAWCESPAQMLDIARRQRSDPQLRTAHAQLEVLGVDLAALQPAVLELRGVPDSVRLLLEPGNGGHAGARCVALASRLARHLQVGWDNAALGDDFHDAGELLHVPSSAAAELVRQALA